MVTVPSTFTLVYPKWKKEACFLGFYELRWFKGKRNRMPTQRTIRLADFIIKNKGCLHIGKMGDNGHGLLYICPFFGRCWLHITLKEANYNGFIQICFWWCLTGHGFIANPDGLKPFFRTNPGFAPKRLKVTLDWVVVSMIHYFHPYLGKIPILTYIFQVRWNHQLVDVWLYLAFFSFPSRPCPPKRGTM